MVVKNRLTYAYTKDAFVGALSLVQLLTSELNIYSNDLYNHAATTTSTAWFEKNGRAVAFAI